MYMYVSIHGYVFRCALRYQAESWHGGRGRAHEVCGHIFKATSPGVKGHAGVIWGQPVVKFLRNVLWPPNLVGRIPDQSVMHCCGRRSCRGQLGSSRSQFA